MKIKSGYILKKVAENYIVVPVGARAKEFNGMITLSESSAILWKLLEKGADKEDMINALLAEYNVERAVVENDVEKFTKKLTEAGLVE